MNYAQIPFTNLRGLILSSEGDGQGGVVWVPGSAGLREMSIDWAWSGATVLPTSPPAGYIPPKRIPVMGGQVVTILGVQYFGRTGGDVFKLNYNGSDLGGPTTWTTVTNTWTVDITSAIFPIIVADGDSIRPIFTTAAGDGWAVGVIYTTT